MLLQKQCTRTSKAIVRREKSASNVHQGRSSLVELENPATEHSDAFFAFLPPTTLPLDDDPIKTVISVKTMQSLLRTLFSTRSSWSSSKIWILERTKAECDWLSLEGRSRPTHRSNLTDWNKYQAANLVASSSSTFSFPLPLRESQPNLLTMQARRPRRGVDGRRWRKCPLKRASRSHLHDGVDDGGGAQNAKEVECWRRK